MSNQVSLVTGTNSGFGWHIARTLAENGHKVYATMRNTESVNSEKAQSLKQWADENNYYLTVLDIDLTDESAIKDALGTIVSESGKIDNVVNNAGAGGMGLTESFSKEQMQKHFDINFFAPWLVTKAALPHMRKEKNGLIINITSTVGRFGMPMMSPYTATKWALEGLTQTLSDELRETGIETVILQPGMFPTTDFFKDISSYSAETDDTVMADYGSMAKMPENLNTSIQQIVENGDAPDNKMVAEGVWEVINSPAGQRPSRKVVDAFMGDMFTEYNKKGDELHNNVMVGFGLKEAEVTS